jgi:chromosome segregation ATPase
MINNCNDSLKEEMEFLEEFNTKLNSILHLYNKLQYKLQEKNKLISLLTSDLIDTKKEIEELHITIEFYKEKNIFLKNHLEEINKKLEETKESVISEIKILYEKIIRRDEESTFTPINDGSFIDFNGIIKPIVKNGNKKI